LPFRVPKPSGSAGGPARFFRTISVLRQWDNPHFQQRDRKIYGDPPTSAKLRFERSSNGGSRWSSNKIRSKGDPPTKRRSSNRMYISH
jgi:hypothetical protein